MGWKDLLQSSETETMVSPWVGGRSLRTYTRQWQIDGRLPQEFGWHQFRLIGPRKANWAEPVERSMDIELQQRVSGYLVGDRIVPDRVRVENPAVLARHCERVHLIEPGLDRFVRIVAGRFWEDGPLIYDSQEFPLGPEDDVLKSYLDDETSVNHIPGVAPALDAAFRFETWQRAEARRRREEERRRREEEERQRLAEERRIREEAEREMRRIQDEAEREERRRRMVEQLGDGAGRRAMAGQDFEEAATAALAVGNAVYLDHHQAHGRNEMVVRFRLNRRRFECVCDAQTLRIIDAGICLTNESDEELYGIGPGESGGNLFTLESLPGVIREAEQAGQLVVFRHVD